MSVELQADANPTDTSACSMLNSTSFLPNLRDGSFPGTINGRQQRPCVLQLFAGSYQGLALECMLVPLAIVRDKKLFTS